MQRTRFRNSTVAGIGALSLLLCGAAFITTGMFVSAEAQDVPPFSAVLSGDQEVPPVDTEGSGEGRFGWIDDDLKYDITFRDLSSPVTAAHFHRGWSGQNGPVIEPINVSGNNATGTWPNLTQQQMEMLRNGEIYVNIHTANHPSGEIRGQVVLRGGQASSSVSSGTGTSSASSSSSSSGTGTVPPMVNDWPEVSRTAAADMVATYGEPHEHTEHMLLWYDVGPWQKIVVHRDPVQHDFPVPHEDVLEQVIRHDVAPGMFDDLALFDGSVVAKRTPGLLAAYCDIEAMNFLALNLAHEVATGQRGFANAREFFAQTAAAYRNGQTSEYTDGLRFTPSGNGDPDVSVGE